MRLIYLSYHSPFSRVFASFGCLAADKANITFKTDGAYPESVNWSEKHGGFLVASGVGGAVRIVNLKGEYKSFIADDQLVSSVGVLVDNKRNHVGMANSDLGLGKARKPLRFGIAIASIIAGITFRILFDQMRRNPIEWKRLPCSSIASGKARAGKQYRGIWII